MEKTLPVHWMTDYSGTNQYLSMPAWALSGTVLSYMAYVKCAIKNQIQTLFSDGNQGGGVGFIWIYRSQNGNNLCMQYYNGSTVVTVTAVGFFAGLDNTRIHVAVVADYIAGTVKIYRNSALFYEHTALDSMYFPESNLTKYLGCYQPTLHFLDGQMCEAMLYTRIVTQAELETYNTFPPPNPNLTNLVFWLTMTEGTGTSVTDKSGNGHTGTLVGATWIVEPYIHKGPCKISSITLKAGASVSTLILYDNATEASGTELCDISALANKTIALDYPGGIKVENGVHAAMTGGGAQAQVNIG